MAYLALDDMVERGHEEALRKPPSQPDLFSQSSNAQQASSGTRTTLVIATTASDITSSG